MTETDDLFEKYDELPEEVQAILNSYQDQDNTYTVCEQLLKELEKVGYTFDYDLTAEPYDLRKIDSPAKPDEKPIEVNGYKIQYSSSWEDYQVSHPEIGACGQFNNLDDAIDYCNRG